DGEVEVLRHEVGHDPRLPVVGGGAVGEHSLEWDAGADGIAIAGGVRDDVVQLAEVDAGLGRHGCCLRGGECLGGVDQVVAQLHDLPGAGPADVHDRSANGSRAGRAAGRTAA